MQDRVRIAAATLPARPGEIAGNVEMLTRMTIDAAEAGAQLVLFPELSLTGFIPNHPTADHEAWLRAALLAARRAALRLDAPPIRELQAAAAERNILISVGLLEDAGNRLYNAQILIGADGIVGHWRKLHVPMFETPFYNGGHTAPVIETPLGRIGANICFDALLPESTRLLAVQNVEIVLMPFAADPSPRTPAGWEAWASGAIRARAAENGVFVVACNYVGEVECAGVRQDFPGGGLIVGPRGESLATWTAAAGESGLILADLTADMLATARAEPEYLFRFRRPELYGSLACE